MGRKVSGRGHLSASDSQDLHVFLKKFFLLSLRDGVDRIPRLLILLNARKTGLLYRVSNGIWDHYVHGSDFTQL